MMSGRKKILFSFITLIILYGILEFFSFVMCLGLDRRAPEPSRRYTRQLQKISTKLHPYLGIDSKRKFDKVLISQFGEVNTECASEAKMRAEDEVIIGVFGGSTTSRFSQNARGALERELKSLEEFKNKKFVIVELAAGAYKQPQQLILLDYALAMGGYFDIVLNIDGYNDIVMAQTINISQNVYPFYPSYWRRIISKVTNLEELVLIAKIAAARERLNNLSVKFSNTPLKYSKTMNLAAHMIKRYTKKKISGYILELQELERQDYSVKRIGPPLAYKDREDLINRLVTVWKNCSLQMHKICASNGIQYFHFLQPSKFIRGSKPLTAKEKKGLKNKNVAYRCKVVRDSYSKLREEGKELADSGVNFYDLTMVFKDTDETIYFDHICHFNKEGHEILGKIVGENMVRFFSQIRKADL